MKQRLTMLLAAMLLMVGTAVAQTKVNGTVISQDDNQPVIGASVLVVGTEIGTVTDANGKFSLTCPAGKNTLRITYVGMEPLEVSARPNMRIMLTSDQQALDEVIVVAYGTQKKSAFTGSAAVVGAAELSQHTVTNITQALQGAVPGLQLRGTSGAPGAGNASINIRGISSLYSDTEPLIIVDGAPYSASLSNIPAEDIESVSVLKDAASAALYGARGANGVIIITTKKGKQGEAKVNLDMKWGVNSRAVQDYDRITDPAQFYETYYSQVYNNYFYQQGLSAAEANAKANSKMLTDLGYNIYTVPDGELLIGMNGKLNPNAKMGRSYEWNGETYYLQADDWTDAAYKTALRQEYNVNVTAGSDKGSFYASAGYLKDDGIIEYSGYRRTSVRVKADYQIKPWMKVGANIGYVHSDQKSNPNLSTDWGSTNLMYYTSYIAPIYPIYVRVLDENGNPIIRTDANNNPQYDYGVPSTNYGIGRAFMQTGNPLGSNRYNNTNNVGNQFNGTFNIDINILKNLKFSATSNVNFGQTTYSWYDNALYGPKVVVNGELQKRQSNTLRQNHVQTLTYMNQFGKHSLTAMIGHEWYDTKTRYLNAIAQGGFSSDIQEIAAFAGKNASQSSSYTTEYNVEGYFFNALYNYDEKYYGSVSYRRDASSRFQKDHRWGSFWSVGAAWLINKEKFMEDQKWVDLLKLKLSVGQQGNDNTQSWAYIDTYSLTPASTSQMSPTFRLTGNPELTWETLTNFNVGLEFAFLKNRIQGSLDYYYKKTTDLLFWLSIPEANGSRGYYGNMGDIRNSGVELSLTGNVIHSKLIDWNITFNISHNTTKILKLPSTKTADNGGFIEDGRWFAEGGPMYNYITYAYAGVNENGEALYWYDEDLSPAGGHVDEEGNLITNNISKPGQKRSGTTTLRGEASRYTTGSTLPKAHGGFGTTLRVGDFDASVNFDYQIGGKIYDYNYQKLMTPAVDASDAGYTYHKDILNSWSYNNTSSTVPRFVFGDQYTAMASDRWLTSAKYLNFQSFTVGYSVPKKLVAKLHLSKVRIYAAGENLCFWSARKGLDPRYSFQETESVNTYSPMRTISGGVQLSF